MCRWISMFCGRGGSRGGHYGKSQLGRGEDEAVFRRTFLAPKSRGNLLQARRLLLIWLFQQTTSGGARPPRLNPIYWGFLKQPDKQETPNYKDALAKAAIFLPSHLSSRRAMSHRFVTLITCQRKFLLDFRTAGSIIRSNFLISGGPGIVERTQSGKKRRESKVRDPGQRYRPSCGQHL
jgi:hypothetical protein